MVKLVNEDLRDSVLGFVDDIGDGIVNTFNGGEDDSSNNSSSGIDMGDIGEIGSSVMGTDAGTATEVGSTIASDAAVADAAMIVADASEGSELDKNMKFNDEYFPRIDLTNRKRYKSYRYKGKMFVYDTENNVVIHTFKDDEEVKALGKDAPLRTLDSIGLRPENWKNKEARNEYLDEWIFDMDAEGERLANDFIKYELPYYSESKSVNEKDWKLKLDSEISNNLRNAIGDGDYYGVLSNLKRAYTFINKECPDYFDSDDLESANEELDNIINAYESGDYDEDEYDCSEDYIEDEIDYALNDFWNLCDNIDMWVPLSEKKLSKKSDLRLSENVTKNYKVKIFMPYYKDDEDMCYTSTTVEATSGDHARQLGNKYIKNKKTSKNSKIWKDAKIDSIKEI